MANLKEIRTRISSVKSTRQITSAMKMVSAAKLRRAQDIILQMRPYANKLQAIQDDLCRSLSDSVDMPLHEHREAKKVVFIIISSNKGLCGAFNGNVAKEVMQTIQNSDKYKKLFEEDKLELVCIGKKAGDILKAKKYPPTESLNEIYDDLQYQTVAFIGKRLIERFLSKEIDEVVLFYNQFKNAALQILMKEQLLPVKSAEEPEEELNAIHNDYILEPSNAEIIKEIMPKLVKTNLYSAILDSNASEHGARMTAMHQATDNATELIKVLQLDYNKARQAAITNEILEIVGGAEALNG